MALTLLPARTETMAINGQRRGYVSLLIFGIALSGGCAVAPPCEAPSLVAAPSPQIRQVPAFPESGLQQKIKVQEKRITELTMQLNLLKRIDRDRSKDR